MLVFEFRSEKRSIFDPRERLDYQLKYLQINRISNVDQTAKRANHYDIFQLRLKFTQPTNGLTLNYKSKRRRVGMK
jgi:hypothetical protein